LLEKSKKESEWKESVKSYPQKGTNGRSKKHNWVKGDTTFEREMRQT